MPCSDHIKLYWGVRTDHDTSVRQHERPSNDTVAHVDSGLHCFVQKAALFMMMKKNRRDSHLRVFCLLIKKIRRVEAEAAERRDTETKMRRSESSWLEYFLIVHTFLRSLHKL